MYKKNTERRNQIPKAGQFELKYCGVSGTPSFDAQVRGAWTTGDYCSRASDNTGVPISELQHALPNSHWNHGISHGKLDECQDEAPSALLWGQPTKVVALEHNKKRKEA